MFISQEAREYAQANGIKIIGKDDQSKPKKPEHMTNLNAKQLVLKNHPRIILRGKIDTFQAKTLEVQILADELGHRNMVNMLGEVNDYARKILVADLMDKPLDDSITLIGLNEQELRFVSQHPTQYFGVGHIAPSYKMGKLAIELNLLRAMSREVELAAINAFADGEVRIERKDILRALNRLSSALYIMYLEVLAEGGES
ncbi:MAG: cobalamin adenosyltransferase [Firmicutes bacterium]|nr:cobalamin adenosyltransferase [Bacillota bacterium]